MSSKLTAFLSKSKKKAPPKTTATAETVLTSSLSVPAASSKGAVGAATEETTPVLDVVQPKVLEQWRVDEDDVSEEVSAAVNSSRVRVSAGMDEDDDGEVDLPSSKVKGNFEWKKKSEEAASVKKEEPPAAARPIEDNSRAIGGVLRLRRKEGGPGADLENHESFPELKQPTSSGPDTGNSKPAAAAASSSGPSAGSSTTVKKSKAADTVKTTIEPSSSSTVTVKNDDTTPALSAVEKVLTADDIWAVLRGKWASKWGRIAVDETLTRNRFQRMQFLVE